MTAKNKLSELEEVPQEVDRIRDIIFGSQMRTYEGNFQTILTDIERLQQEIDHLNQKLVDQEKKHRDKFQTLDREMRKNGDALRNEVQKIALNLSTEKVDRQGLGELIVELGNRLKAGDLLVDSITQMLDSKED